MGERDTAFALDGHVAAKGLDRGAWNDDKKAIDDFAVDNDFGIEPKRETRHSGVLANSRVPFRALFSISNSAGDVYLHDSSMAVRQRLSIPLTRRAPLGAMTAFWLRIHSTSTSALIRSSFFRPLASHRFGRRRLKCCRFSGKSL